MRVSTPHGQIRIVWFMTSSSDAFAQPIAKDVSVGGHSIVGH